MKHKLLLILLALPFFGNAQTIQKSDLGVKIYSYQSSIYENRFWFTLYKIDWNAKTLQYALIEFKEGDKIADIESITQVFRNAVPPSKFIILGPNKIKVERIRRKRSWLNFATASVKSSPAERYFINGDRLSRRKKGGLHVLDKELTLRYEQEKNKQ